MSRIARIGSGFRPRPWIAFLFCATWSFLGAWYAPSSLASCGDYVKTSVASGVEEDFALHQETGTSESQAAKSSFEGDATPPCHGPNCGSGFPAPSVPDVSIPIASERAFGENLGWVMLPAVGSNATSAIDSASRPGFPWRPEHPPRS